jgi:hypothetical protein
MSMTTQTVFKKRASQMFGQKSRLAVVHGAAQGGKLVMLCTHFRSRPHTSIAWAPCGGSFFPGSVLQSAWRDNPAAHGMCALGQIEFSVQWSACLRLACSHPMHAQFEPPQKTDKQRDRRENDRETIHYPVVVSTVASTVPRFLTESCVSLQYKFGTRRAILCKN